MGALPPYGLTGITMQQLGLGGSEGIIIDIQHAATFPFLFWPHQPIAVQFYVTHLNLKLFSHL